MTICRERSLRRCPFKALSTVCRAMPLAVHHAFRVVPFAMKAARTARSSSAEAGIESGNVCLIWCMRSCIHQMWCYAMAEWSNLEIVPTLREAMAKRSVKLTDLARLTGIPYRSLQNYFSRKTEMPASVYLKICAQLGLDPFYVKEEKFLIEYYPLRKALVRTLGGLLPTHDFLPDRTMALVEYSGEPRTEHQLWKDAGTVAILLAGAYDQERELELHSPLIDDDDYEGSSKGSPITEPADEGSSKK